ncbi:type 4b pilus protein PilO2 [Vreelandella rituensis]|uniref:Pilin accessory protein (PilO) n=1 Tax=Vreelandella rituensis TaxID=2282306 RepID=A0A368UB61_9GAMM|nr:type 4b pilus protein PilO2 [Halomonas rituensis]RCV93817.1 hypothetical protein DU506_01275 [Halomonas rituensis]
MDTSTLHLKSKRRHWIAGLYWHSRDSGREGSSKQEVLNAAEELYAQLSQTEGEELVGVLISGNRFQQVGFHAPGEVPVNSYSLAQLALAAYTKTMPLPTVMGRLALSEDHHWVFKIQRGKISFAGDKVIPAEDSESELKRLQQTAPDNASIIDILDVTEASQQILAWEKSVKSSRLHKAKPFKVLRKLRITQHRFFKPAAIVATLAIAVMGGNVGYETHKDYKERQAEVERQERLRILQDVGPAPRPWTDAPPLWISYKRCTDQYQQGQAFRAGWSTVSWSCDQDNVTRHWHRGEHGSFSILPAEGDFVVEDPNRLIEATPLPEVEPRGTTPIVDRASAAQLLMDLARLHEFQARFKWGRENTRRVPRGNTFITENLGHATHRLELSGDQIPSVELMKGIEKIPSISLVELSESSNSWTLILEFYAEA